MAAPLGAAAPATVIAVSLKAGLPDHPVASATRQDFANLVGSSLAQGCDIQTSYRSDMELALALIIPAGSQTLSILRRLLNVQADFHRTHADARVRFLAHHGIVFPSAAGHIGSSLRQAHARLNRMASGIDRAATTDFANFCAPWAAQHISFRQFAQDEPGIVSFRLKATPLANAADDRIDDALVEHLTSCLAAHLGPFASVIVNAARRSSTTPRQLLEELCNEIDDPQARARFREAASGEC